jgi:hypothetical protein
MKTVKFKTTFGTAIPHERKDHGIFLDRILQKSIGGR